jgi:hypothetical protein
LRTKFPICSESFAFEYLTRIFERSNSISKRNRNAVTIRVSHVLRTSVLNYGSPSIMALCGRVRANEF